MTKTTTRSPASFRYIPAKNLDDKLSVLVAMEGSAPWAFRTQFDDLQDWCSKKKSRVMLLVQEREEAHFEIGCYAYHVGGSSVFIKSLTIIPDYRRNGIGSRVIKKLSETFPGMPLTCAVDDRDLATHLFLRSNGFVAYKIMDGGKGGRVKYLFQKDAQTKDA